MGVRGWHVDAVSFCRIPNGLRAFEIIDDHGGPKTMAHFQNRMRPIHPGEILREEYLAPLGMTARALAAALRMSAVGMEGIVCERRNVTADTARRLARYFGGDAGSWLNLQQAFDLKIARAMHGDQIEKEVSPRAAVLAMDNAAG